MPKINGKHFAYSEKGKKAAKEYAKKMKKRSRKMKKGKK